MWELKNVYFASWIIGAWVFIAVCLRALWLTRDWEGL